MAPSLLRSFKRSHIGKREDPGGRGCDKRTVDDRRKTADKLFVMILVPTWGFYHFLFANIQISLKIFRSPPLSLKEVVCFSHSS